MYTISHCISFMKELTPRAKLMSDCFLQFRACDPMPCIRSVQLPQLYLTFCDPMNCSTPFFPVRHQLWSLKISCTSSRWYHPTVSSSLVHFSFLHSIFPSIRVFSNESLLHIRWPKYWSFSFSISPSKDYSGLITFKMDWLDLLAIQGILKSLLQHHNSKASILWHSAFFMVQLSHHTYLLEKTQLWLDGPLLAK